MQKWMDEIVAQPSGADFGRDVGLQCGLYAGAGANSGSA
jgi:hypothetical protein